MIHTVKGFGIVNKGEIDVFLELSCFFDDQPSLSICIGEGNGTPLQYSCLENPMDGGAWWTAVHRVANSRARLTLSDPIDLLGSAVPGIHQARILEWVAISFSNA